LKWNDFNQQLKKQHYQDHSQHPQKHQSNQVHSNITGGTNTSFEVFPREKKYHMSLSLKCLGMAIDGGIYEIAFPTAST